MSECHGCKAGLTRHLLDGVIVHFRPYSVRYCPREGEVFPCQDQATATPYEIKEELRNEIQAREDC